MSKALETINKVKAFIMGQDVLILPSEISEIEEILTPPTVEEVCKELSKLYNRKVFYTNTKYHNGFHFKDGWYIVKYKNGRIRFTQDYMFHVNDLPPKLIALIGRFYESLEEGNEEYKKKVKRYFHLKKILGEWHPDKNELQKLYDEEAQDTEITQDTFYRLRREFNHLENELKGCKSSE